MVFRMCDPVVGFGVYDRFHDSVCQPPPSDRENFPNGLKNIPIGRRFDPKPSIFLGLGF
jgi:hypothetical protein